MGRVCLLITMNYDVGAYLHREVREMWGSCMDCFVDPLEERGTTTLRDED